MVGIREKERVNLGGEKAGRQTPFSAKNAYLPQTPPNLTFISILNDEAEKVLFGRMGFFDRLLSRPSSSPTPAKTETSESASPHSPASASAAVMPRIAQARALLEAKDLAGATALYEQILEDSGDRADVLVTISGDLGSLGHVKEIIEWIAPRYDAQRHGHGTGINVLQAYLALGNAEAAQHCLDILFSLGNPDIEERLHGFSNAIANLIEERRQGRLPSPKAGLPSAEEAAHGAQIPLQISLVSISKPVWYYGLEELTAEILPNKGGKLRRIAFAQIAVLGAPAIASTEPGAPAIDPELAMLSRALPLWFMEGFYYSQSYLPLAVLAIASQGPGSPENQFANFGREWSSNDLRQLTATSSESLDYLLIGAMQRDDSGTELSLSLLDARKLREIKKFTTNWQAGGMGEALATLKGSLQTFMECKPYPAGSGISYAPPKDTAAWLPLLEASASSFLVQKEMLPKARLPQGIAANTGASDLASNSLVASLAVLTLADRAAKLDINIPVQSAALVQDSLVLKASDLLTAQP